MEAESAAAPPSTSCAVEQDQAMNFYQVKAKLARDFARMHTSSKSTPQQQGVVSSDAPDSAAQQLLQLRPVPYGLQVSTIAPGLLLASCQVERLLELLIQHNVTHILQVGSELTPSHPKRFTYLHLDAEDLEEQDLLTLLPAGLSFIQQGLASKTEAGGGVVLVHCLAGVSRSAAVVMAHLMWAQGLSFPAARDAVKAARPRVCPNLGFTLQLQQFDAMRLAGLVQWGDTASLQSSLDRCWAPWNLQRFLQTKREATGTKDGQEPEVQASRLPLKISTLLDRLS